MRRESDFEVAYVCRCGNKQVVSFSENETPPVALGCEKCKAGQGMDPNVQQIQLKGLVMQGRHVKQQPHPVASIADAAIGAVSKKPPAGASARR